MLPWISHARQVLIIQHGLLEDNPYLIGEPRRPAVATGTYAITFINRLRWADSDISDPLG